MRPSIFKYTLEKTTDSQYVEVKGFQKITHIGMDPNGEICLWAMVDIDDEVESSLGLMLCMTGHDLPGGMYAAKHINTFIDEGWCVLHAYLFCINGRDLTCPEHKDRIIR